MTFRQYEAINLFNDYALYIHQDIIPADNVARLLTAQAVEATRAVADASGHPRDYYGDWKAPTGEVLTFFTLNGFLEAVSQYNTLEYVKRREERKREEEAQRAASA